MRFQGNKLMKSTVAEIRARFDADVERFSNLETGQSATMDAPIALELIAEAAAATTPGATRLLDVGCGAGNFSLRVLERLPKLTVTLVDLSQPMLARATARLQAAGCSVVPGPFPIAIGNCAVVMDPFDNTLTLVDMTKGPRVNNLR